MSSATSSYTHTVLKNLWTTTQTPKGQTMRSISNGCKSNPKKSFGSKMIESPFLISFRCRVTSTPPTRVVSTSSIRATSLMYRRQTCTLQPRRSWFVFRSHLLPPYLFYPFLVFSIFVRVTFCWRQFCVCMLHHNLKSLHEASRIFPPGLLWQKCSNQEEASAASPSEAAWRPSGHEETGRIDQQISKNKERKSQ